MRLTRSDTGHRLPRFSAPAAPPGTPEPEEPAIRIRRSAGVEALGATAITVRFGDLVANDAVSLSAAAGMVTALIGPNGAGKTTFFNVLTGAVRPAGGRVTVFGSDAGAITPAKAARPAPDFPKGEAILRLAEALWPVNVDSRRADVADDPGDPADDFGPVRV